MGVCTRWYSAGLFVKVVNMNWECENEDGGRINIVLFSSCLLLSFPSSS